MAFPSNSTVIDDFNRADETPVGSPWAAAKIQGGTQDLRVVGNELAANVSTGNGYVDVAYGPGVEAALTINTVNGAYEAIWFLTSGQGTTNWSAYFLVHEYFAGADTWRIRKRVAPGSSVTLATNAAGPDVAVNDSLGFELTASGVLTAYHKPAGGAWSSVATATDTELGSSGRIAFEADSISARYDNFSGGTIVSAPSGGEGRMLLLGVGD